jgi:hypothetical protein
MGEVYLRPDIGHLPATNFISPLPTSYMRDHVFLQRFSEML